MVFVFLEQLVTDYLRRLCSHLGMNNEAQQDTANLSEGILHVVIMEISRNADCIYRE